MATLWTFVEAILMVFLVIAGLCAIALATDLLQAVMTSWVRSSEVGEPGEERGRR